MFKVALIGKWHVHAKDYAGALSKLDDVEIVAVNAETPEVAQEWAAELGCKVMSQDEIWADTSIEGVCVCTATNLHPEVLIAAAHAKKAIFTEKVMTLTKADALRVAEAVRANGVRFTISFVHTCESKFLYAKELVDSGALGEITYARMKKSHNGSLAGWLPPHFYDPIECGGGAMIDLGAHPMYLLNWYLGKPTHIQSTFTNFTDKPVEDNAVSVLSYANGAIGVSETGFVSTGVPLSLELIGTKGSMLLHHDLVQNIDGAWKVVTELPEHKDSPVVQWARGIENPDCGIERAIELSEIMEAAYESHRTKARAAL